MSNHISTGSNVRGSNEKMRMSESDKAPGIELLNRYIKKNLEYYKALAGRMQDDRKPEWETLEVKFRELPGYWTM